MSKMVQITSRDMVAVALQPLKAGETVSFGAKEITLKDDLPMGHKAAMRDIRKGEAVIKYGYPIGEATEDIPEGGHVHTHNLHTLLSSVSKVCKKRYEMLKRWDETQGTCYVRGMRS